jgi:hypothetical protein
MLTRFLRALVLTTGVYSLLLWLYVVGRLVFAGVDITYPFLDSVPGISIALVGVVSFVVSFLCALLYLTIWGWRGRTA